MSGIVAVTGATGFIGRTLINALSRDGWRIRALTRQNQPSDNHITWVSGDLDNRDALQELVHGCEAVIHCAGQVRGSSLEDFNHTNVEGTENILQASANQDPQPRFLLISSLAARESQLSWYAKSKYLAEQATINYTGILPWTIFRPTAGYGPGDKELSPLFKTSRLGILPAIGLNPGRFSLLHVNDLVSAILAWVSAKTIMPGLYELDDGTPEGYDYRLLAATASQVWKRSVVILPIPVALIRAMAGINLCLARLFHYSPMLTPGKVREIQHPNWICNNSPLTQALGWKPEIELIDALPQAIIPT